MFFVLHELIIGTLNPVGVLIKVHFLDFHVKLFLTLLFKQ